MFASCLLAPLALAACAAPEPAPEPAPDVLAINVLLEPDAAMQAAAIAANGRLRAAYPAGFALDADHASHITILQRFVRRTDLDEVIAAVAQVARETQPTAEELTATGLYSVPWEGVAMIGIAVTPTARLQALQERLIAALARFQVPGGGVAAFVAPPAGRRIGAQTLGYVRDFVPRAAGGNFRPHVTVGLAEPASAAGIVAESFTPFRFRAGAVAVYQLGEHCTAGRRLWTSGQVTED